ISFAMNSPNVSVAQGGTFGVSYQYQDYDSNVTVTIYLDRDQNPYNGNEVATGTWNENLTGANPSNHDQQANTSNVQPGTYFAYARISDGTHTRYYYAPGTATILPPNTTAVAPGNYSGILFSNTAFLSTTGIYT